MPIADALPDAIATTAKALGVLDGAGDLNRAFFDHPLQTVAGMFTEPPRRQQLLDALPVLLGEPATETVDGRERRRYPLVTEEAAEVAVTVDLAPATVGPDVTVLVCVRAILTDDPDGSLTAELDLPLVRAAGTELQAVCGREDDGPIVLRLAFALPDGLLLRATAAAHDGGGWLAARIEGVVVNNTPIPPLEVRSDTLADDALELFQRLIQVAAALLDGGGSAAQLLQHLPGLLGLDDPARALPVRELFSGDVRWREWLGRLAEDQAASLQAWLEHVAGLLGVELEDTGAAPTPSAPWILPLHAGLPELAVTVALEDDAAGTRHLLLGLRVAMVATAPADARVQAEVTVLDLPLTGAAPEAWFASGRVAVVAPDTAGRRLAPPGPIDPNNVPAFAVGHLTAGIRWTGDDVQPALELDDVRVDGNDYDRLDLTDADTLADTVADELATRLRDLLGSSPAATAVLVLAGIEATAGQRVDLGLLATDPIRAIADHHRRLLETGDWHGPGGPLRRLAGLLGVADPVPLEGDGTAASPWQLPLASDGLRLLLTASTADTGADRQLQLGLRLEPADTAAGPSLDASLTLLAVRFGEPVELRPLDRVRCAVGTAALAEGPVRVAGATLEAGWSTREGFTAAAALRGLALTLSGEDGQPTSFDLGDLRLLPSTFDASAPDLGLGLDPAVLAAVVVWAARQLAASLDPLGGAVAAGLADAAEELLGDPARLDRLAADPEAVLRAVVRVVAAQAGGAASPLLEALSGRVATAAGAAFDGAGRPFAPWSWRPDPADGVALTAWLAPAGPLTAAPPVGATNLQVDPFGPDDGSAVALAEATERGDLDPLPALAEATAEALGAAAGVDAEVAALAAGRDLGAVAEGLAVLADFCQAGDGLLPVVATGPPADWGQALAAAAPLTTPFDDPGALTGVADELDGWAGGALVLIAPAWWPAASWEPLVGELARRHPEWRWAELDLRRDPLAAVATVAAADGYVVLVGDDPAQHVPAVLDRLAGLLAGPGPVLAAVDPGTALLGWVAGHQSTVRGLLTIGLRFAADPDSARWDTLAEVVRVAEPLLADHPTWGPLAAAWRELADGQTAPEDGRPAQVGRLRPADLAAPPTLPDLGTLPRRALVATAGGGILEALAESAARRAAQDRTPTGLTTGVGAPVPLPVAAGPVRASVTVRLDLATYGLDAVTGGAQATAVVRAVLARTDGGWLTGPPAADRLAAVRRLTVTATAPLGRMVDAEVLLELQDTCLGGVCQPVCSPEQAGFTALLTAVLDALPEGDPHVDAALQLAADHLGMVARTGPRWQVDATGLERLLSDPGGTLAARAAAMSGTGLLGFTPDPAAPGGVRRLVRALGPRLQATLDPDARRLRVQTRGDGVPLGEGAWLRTDVTANLGDGRVTAAWALSAAGVTVERTATGVVQLLLPDDPANPVVVGPGSDPEALVGRLVRRLPALLAAALASVLLEQATGRSVPPPVLLPWLVDPLGTLSRTFRGGTVGAAAAEVAGALGLPVDQDGTVTLLPGVLGLAARADPDGGVRVVAVTPGTGWSPAPGLVLSMAAGLRLDQAGAARPTGVVTLTADLAQASGSDSWGEVGLEVAYDADGPRISLLPGTEAPIQLVPRFSGFDAIVGAAAERFLPRVLDALVDEVPDTPLKQHALAVATALEVYGPSFAAAPVPLRELTLDRLRSRAAQLAAAVGALAEDVLESASGTTVVVTPLADGVRVTMTPVAGGSLGLTVTVAGELSLTVALDQLALGPVAAGLSAQATSAESGVALAGSASAELDLADALRISPGPRLTVSLAADGTVSVVLLPLPDLLPAEAAFELLPTPRVVLSPTAGGLLAQRWLVAPGLDLLLRLMAERGLLDRPIVASGPGSGPPWPTWTQVLTNAGLLENGRVQLPLDPAALPGAALAFTDQLQIPVTDDLVVRVVRDGPADDGRVGVGLGLTGTVPIEAGGDVAPTVMLGDLGGDGQPPTGGLEVVVLRGSGTSWTIDPRVRLGRTGVRATGSRGRDLLIGGPMALTGVEGRLDLTAMLAIGGGDLTFDGLGAELRALGIGLPGMGGGSGNPVAGSLLAPAAAAGDKVAPRLDLGLRFSTDQGLELLVGGLDKGETLWVPVNQTFGPLHIAQVGLRADTGTFSVGEPPAPQELDYVGLLVDGGVALGPLQLAVKGLGVQVPVAYVDRPSAWRLTLDGLAVAFDGAGITIAGGLERGESGGVIEYRGFLVVRAFGFGAAAIGAYAVVDGQPSFYAFAVVDAPIGGPPYLFITGLAGGLGFNRTLRTPGTPEQVPGFPLVAIMREGGAVQPDALLSRMGDTIRPAVRSYWFAAGLKFSTFELLKTIALGYVTFTPSGVEIGLLGLMSAPVPSAEEKIAQLELGLLARFSSADQTLAVLAQLTRNSWLFTEDCRLTGGFAFMVWFAKPQVVLTVGGYGPLYAPPDYFPQVPELGFRWQVTDDVVIKGGTYYAVTPEVMTVGGRLEASASFSGGHANLTMYAHAAMWFWPPRFVLNLGFRVTGKIFGCGFDVGCDVRIELPPLWGRVTIHFMGEHRFTFGTREAAQQFLATLEAFVRAFVASDGEVHKLDVPAGLALPDTRADAGTSGGARPTGTVDDPWPVAPEFTLAITTALPAVSATLNGQAVAGVAGGISSLHALPLDPSMARLNPTHEVTLVNLDTNAAVPATRLAAGTTSTGVPTGIYGVNGGTGSFHPPDQDSPPTQGKAQLDLAIGGLQVTASTQLTSSPGAAVVTLGRLVDETAPGDLPLDPEPAPVPPIPPVPPAQPLPPAPEPEAAAVPRLRWSTVARDGTSAAERLLAADGVEVGPGETQLWDLPHDRPATRLLPGGSLGRVVVLDPMGQVLADGAARETTLARHAASLVVGGPAGGERAGWQPATRLLPVTRWVLVAPGATVQLPTIGWWPATVADPDGVPAEVAVPPGTPGVATRFADGTRVDTVVVTLDARRSGAALTDLAVSAEGGRLGTPAVVRDDRWRRVTLVYPVQARDRDGLLTVSLVVEPSAWVIAGTVGLAGDADGWRSRIEAEPSAPLLDGAGRQARAAEPEAAAAGPPEPASLRLGYEEEMP